jgi:hypothetical protein
LEFRSNDLYKFSILEWGIQGRWVGSLSDIVCSKSSFSPNPQPYVEKLWNRIRFLLAEAISTILPNK